MVEEWLARVNKRDGRGPKDARRSKSAHRRNGTLVRGSVGDRRTPPTSRGGGRRLHAPSATGTRAARGGRGGSAATAARPGGGARRAAVPGGVGRRIGRGQRRPAAGGRRQPAGAAGGPGTPPAGVGKA